MRRRRRHGTIVLAYHNIVPRGEPILGDSSLHLPQRQFAEQLELLQHTHEVVPITHLFERAAGERPRAVITFDDACQGAATSGVEELKSRGLPATFFVSPAFVGGRTFWWDELAAGHGGLLPLQLRSHAIHRLAGRDSDVRGWAARECFSLGPVPWHQAAATERQLADAAGTGGVTLASHSWSHANLALLNAAELTKELARPLSWLHERFQAVVPFLSYPYGLRSVEAEQVAQAVGYQGAFLIEGGWVSEPDKEHERFALPRLNVPAGISLNGFALRTSGLVRLRQAVP